MCPHLMFPWLCCYNVLFLKQLIEPVAQIGNEPYQALSLLNLAKTKQQNVMRLLITCR